jgi:hypothetical protein
LQQKSEEYKLEKVVIPMYRGRIYVPNSHKLKNMVLKEMHNVPYVGHPGYCKNIVVVKGQDYWSRMKKEVVNFIANCLACQKVKDEHIYLVGLLQPLPIPEWKSKVVTMDFITKLPRTIKQHDSIMVVVENLTKVAHFIPLNLTHKEINIVDIYMREIIRLYGIPKTIVTGRDPKFTSNFWKGLFKGFGTNMNFSMAYHPESDERTKRSNQVIEDMLRVYVMDKPSKWKD